MIGKRRRSQSTRSWNVHRSNRFGQYSTNRYDSTDQNSDRGTERRVDTQVSVGIGETGTNRLRAMNSLGSSHIQISQRDRGVKQDFDRQ